MLKLDKESLSEKIGNFLGYLVAYLIFTIILFFVLSYLNKLPEGWGYIHILAIGLLISLIGSLIRELLK
ncbi:hypothetical protein AUJ84_02120 [Candidatus Pacearchaeota archaeon CG1_02_32_132]|nr:MAG: hypothetical protein AUJ84_02120 [Candidatus Pacearchaeota archaeon CG1_02_32_132]